MSYCLNPGCQNPQNVKDAKFCIRCGNKLLLGDRYRALKLIGKGGFGRTFLAVDEFKPSKPSCVIKQFFPQAQGTNSLEKASALFEQEAVRLDDLGNHPQIPSLLAYLTQDSRQYLVQEYIDGQNLGEELLEKGKFDEAGISQLLQDLLPLLQFVSDAQVIHRDIKPENIIRRRLDDRLVLVDFGAAKFATMAGSATIIGSAGYAAPEQTIGKATFSSDIYSLGVTCIHLLTGVEPFDLYSAHEANWVWRDYLTEPTSDRLGKILDRMLEGAISKRYGSANEVLSDLNSLSIASETQTPASIPTQSTTSTNWHYVRTLSRHSGIFAGVRGVAISPDGKTLASASEDYAIELWDLGNGTEICSLTGHSHFVRAVIFSRNGEILISSSDDKTVKLWNLETKAEIRTLKGHLKAVTCISISPNGQILASGSDDNTIKVWDLENGTEISTIKGHSGWIQALSFSPDGQSLASGSYDNTVKIWNCSDWQEASCQTVGSAIKSLAFTSDGVILMAGTLDNTIKFWHVSTAIEFRSLKAHSGWISGIDSLAVTPDNLVLASAGTGDKTIKLWSIKTGELLSTLTGHSKGVTSVAFTPDGQSLVSGSYDKTVKIWQRA